MRSGKVILCLLLIWVIAVISAVAETVPGDLEARFADAMTIDFEGQTYRLRSRLTTVLLAGIDQRTNAPKDISGFRSGGQADFLLLLVIDENRDTVQPIHISRDTMTRITILNVLGQVSGTREAQICLAHAFGDGGEQSCELLTSAVSGLLMNVPIDHYYVMNLDGIAVLNDALGGVRVELQQDFVAYDETMTAGSTIVLRGKQAEIFVRQRYNIGDQTDVLRMQRQRQYLLSASETLAERCAENANFPTRLMSALEEYAVTDMGRGRIMNLTGQATKYEILPVIGFSGENRLSESGFMEFYPDEEALMRNVLDAFFEISC